MCPWYCYSNGGRTWYCDSTTVRTWHCNNPAVCLALHQYSTAVRIVSGTISVLQWGLCLTISVLDWGLCLVLHYRTAVRIVPDSTSSFAMRTLTVCLVQYCVFENLSGTCTSTVKKDCCAWYWYNYCIWPSTGVSIACVNCVWHCYMYSCKDCRWRVQVWALHVLTVSCTATGTLARTVQRIDCSKLGEFLCFWFHSIQLLRVYSC